MNFFQLFLKRKRTVISLFLCVIVFLQTKATNEIIIENATIAFETFQEDLANTYTYSHNGTGSVLVKVTKSNNALTLSIGQEAGFKNNSTAKYIAEKGFIGSYTYKPSLKGYLSNYVINGVRVILIKENLYLYAYKYDANTYRPGIQPKESYIADMYPHQSANANNVPSHIGDLTGSYRFELAKITICESCRKGFAVGVDISTVGNDLHIEPNDLKAEDPNFLSKELPRIIDVHNDRSEEAKDHLSRTFTYDSDRGAFSAEIKKTVGSHFLDLYPMPSGDITVRLRQHEDYNGVDQGILRKVKGSLFDLVNSDKADVSGITGNDWKMEESSIKLSITTAVQNDINIRVNGEVFRLDKSVGGAFESYYGTNESEDEMTLEVINNNKIVMTLGGAKKTLVRNGGRGSISSQDPKSNSSTSYNTRSSSVAGPMDQIMFKAITSENTDSFDTAISEGANINARNTSGNTALHQAVLKNNSDLVEHILSANADVNISNTQGRSPLDLAIQKSTSTDATLAMKLLDNNASVSGYAIDQAILKKNDELLDKVIANGDKKMITNMAIQKGDRPLVEKMISNYGVFVTKEMFGDAVKYRKFPVAELMIENGYNPNDALAVSIKSGASDLVYTAVEAGGNPTSGLTYGVTKNDTQLIDLALEKGADANAGIKEAIAKNSVPLTTKMLENGASPDAYIEEVSGKGKDLLLKALLDNGGDASKGVVAAVTNRKTTTLQLLLKNGADANLGVLPAAEKDNTKMLDMLIKAGADGEPLMPVAIEKNNTAMVTTALEGGADGTKPNYIKKASSNGSVKIVKMLLDVGADANEGLQAAVGSNKTDIVTMLLDAGADGSSGEVLAQSTKHNNPNLSKLLLDAGAPAQDGINEAVANTSDLVLQQLIDAGGDASDQSYLTTVVVKNSTACAKILLKQGLSAQGNDTSGLTYVHHAAKNNNAGLMDLLLKNGADADAVVNGDTPLHLAVRTRNAVSVVQLLITAGADVNARNAKGKTVLKINKGNKTKKLLKENGAAKK